jgi:pimeloyl-ACP methyl ester carboxylesterase
VRIDKRGMFASAKAAKDPNAVKVADYAADVRSWIGVIRKKTGASCVWLLGHSEGGLVSLAAAQKAGGICGVLLVAAPGRKLGDVLREQLAGNPANAPYLPQMFQSISALEAGRSVDVTKLPPIVAPFFAPKVQGFLRDLFRQDPAQLIADMKVPVLIMQGENDLQITLEDVQFLAAARPDAKLVLLPDANHVLKSAPKHSVMENLATYSNSDMPLAPGVIDALAGFIRK